MNNQREVVLYVGKTGSGKSTLFRREIVKKNRFIIFDMIGEYRRLSPAFEALYVRRLTELAFWVYDNYSSNFKMVFDPIDPEEIITTTLSEEVRTIDYFFKLVFNGMQNLTLGIEEIANHCENGHAQEDLRKIIRFGRHYELSVYATTQRPKDIPPVIRAQITRLVSFKMHEPSDIEYLREIIGDEAYTLKDLEPFVYPNMVKGKHYKEFIL